MDESDSELVNFDIDSDPCGADLLALKRELNRLGSEMIKRNLADAIISAQKITLQRWKRYASASALSQLHFVILIADSVCSLFSYCEFVRKGSLDQLCSFKITLSGMGLAYEHMAPGIHPLPPGTAVIM